MASSKKLISILFLFAFFSMQINAREFFSKTPSVNANEKETTTVVPETTKVPEQEPTFMPETQNGYGLYGHESGQLPPSTITTTATVKETYEPYVTPVRYHPDEPYNSISATKTNNNNYKNGYETEQKSLGEARFTERGWETNENNDNNYKNGYETGQKNLGEDRFTERRWSLKGNNNNNNAEKQGMSDTRFLENGKYFYDAENEKNYYPNQFENSKNEFNENRYNNKNMERYNPNQEEFEENEEEFEP